MADHSTVILHHYDTSPFSEKIRLILGLKGLPWGSVKIPSIMPKPDLMPLTGGYRKTPVMQIGADIYCDTTLIATELERRMPVPTLFPDGAPALSAGFCRWTDTTVFLATVGLIFGALADHVPEAFIKDRQEFAGGRFDPSAMKQAVPMMRDQWRSAMGWIDDQLGDGRPFLTGMKPGLSDIAAYMNVWFLKNGHPPSAELLDEFPTLKAWADRVAQLGHGAPTELSSAEALDIAAGAEPVAQAMEDPFDPNGLKPGTAVTVMPDDTGRVPVTGTLASSSAQHVTIARNDARVGRVALHFPRAGFQVFAS